MQTTHSGESIMSLPSCDDIVTSRLSLVAITPEMLKSEQTNDYQRLGEQLQAAIPANWPPVDWEPHVLVFILNQFQERPEQIGWHRHVIFRHPDGTRSLIGSLGAFSKSVPPSECEIGYSILPPFEGKGLATEGAKALIEYLRKDERISSIIAHTFPRLTGSIRVMGKCGLTFDGTGEEEGTIRYRLPLR
jgi:[ribosomal protein S5]-alanine N-acetyltransferase